MAYSNSCALHLQCDVVWLSLPPRRDSTSFIWAACLLRAALISLMSRGGGGAGGDIGTMNMGVTTANCMH